jgi:hypothetical protein
MFLSGCNLSSSTWNMAMVGTTIRAKYISNYIIYWFDYLLIKIDYFGLFLGSYAGAVLGIPLSGILTEYLNWQVAFYFYGKISYKFD